MAKYMDETAFGYFWRSILKPRLEQLVAKEPGKGLSSNDFTAAYKAQVDQNKADVVTLRNEKMDRNGIRAKEFSIAVQSWTGGGPYTATIAEAGVTERTDCRFELDSAALQADVDWVTTGGTITLSTARKPTEAIVGRVILTEVT